MRLCSIADRGCDIQGRYTCYKCGDACCGECSAIRPYLSYLGLKYPHLKVRPHRLCANCWEEEERDQELEGVTRSELERRDDVENILYCDNPLARIRLVQHIAACDECFRRFAALVVCAEGKKEGTE